MKTSQYCFDPVKFCDTIVELPVLRRRRLEVDQSKFGVSSRIRMLLLLRFVANRQRWTSSTILIKICCVRARLAPETWRSRTDICRGTNANDDAFAPFVR